MNNYEQIRTLGQGGFGKAILARRKSDKVQVVIKEVRLTALSPKDREEAQKEVKVLASLKHPYIVEYHESFQERGCLYIVMGYADGGDLAGKIQKAGRKLFSEEEVLHDFIEIALAIKYIHDRKILHRDLKGQNVFLMKDGTVKLGDFGIAKVLDHTFQVCRTQIGTPYYLSPEICMGRNYNSKTDIWSLGCILYELCTLKHAFEAGNMNQLLQAIIRGRYTPISSQYSQDLRNLVDRMLTKEPEKRPTINEVLLTPFIKQKLSDYLDKTLLDYEMQHTVIHGRKAFAAPTMIAPLPKPDPPAPKGDGGGSTRKAADDDAKREEQRRRMIELQKRQEEMERRFRQKNEELEKREAALRQREQQAKNDLQKREERLKQQEAALQKRDHDERAKIAAQKAEIERREAAKRQQEMEDRKRREAEMKAEEERKARQQAYEERNRVAQMNKDRDRGNAGFGGGAYGGGGGGGYDRYGGAAGIADADRQRMYMEQRAAAQANRGRNAGGAADCFNYGGGDDTPPRRPNRAERQAQEDAERRRIFEEQRRQAMEFRNRQRNEEMNGGAARDALGWNDEPDPKPVARRNDPRRQEIEEDERRRIFMEQKRAAQANRDRMRQMEMGGGDVMDALRRDDPDDEPPRKNDRIAKHEIDDDERRRIFMEQKRAAQANRDRMRQMEMGGGDVKDALKRDEDDEPLPQKKKEMNLDEINAYMREQRHIARANKARAQAAENESEFERQLKEAAKDDEPLPQKKKEMNLDEINAYMREQRHIARANKARAQAAENESEFERQLKEAAKEDDEPLPQKKKEMNLEEINAYMREQRHIARANKARAQAAENESEFERQLKEAAKEDNEPPPQKKKEMNLEEINAYMREQRHIARANKARAQAAENESEFERQLKEAAKEDDEPLPQKKKEMNLEEINAFMREQRHIARANKARAQAAENESEFERQLKENAKEDNEPPPQKKKEMNLEEINAYMREQRHIARANRARAMAAEQGIALNDAPAAGEGNQKALEDMSPEELDAYMKAQREKKRMQRDAPAAAAPAGAPPPADDSDDEPPPQKEKKPQMSLAEINAFMREQRHARRANKARAEAEMRGLNMDDIIAQAEREQAAALAAGGGATEEKPAEEKPKQPEPEPEDNEPPPQKEKKPQMSLAEINAFMREQRHARRANKARAEAEMKGLNMDDIIAQAEREQAAALAAGGGATEEKPAEEKPKQPEPEPEDNEPPPQKEKKPQMSLEEINAFMREQRHARRANKARAEAQLQGLNMDDLVAQAEREIQANGGVPPEPEPTPAPQPEPTPAPKPKPKPKPEPSAGGKMTVAEARKKKAQPQQKSSGGSSASDSPRQLLDQQALKDLFREQRDKLRENREKIKKAREGSHDPDLTPSGETKPTRPKSAKAEEKPKPTKRLLKKPEPEPESEPEPEVKMDLSQALNKKSTGEFLKSRSIVLEELKEFPMEDDGGEPESGDAGETAQEDGDGKQLSSIMEQAKALNDALDHLEDNEPVDDPEQGAASSPFFLQNKVLNFPVVQDKDSLSYRAEAIRAFLEREIGLDKLIALKHAVASSDPHDASVEALLKDCEPGIVVLAHQLLVLDETVDTMAY